MVELLLVECALRLFQFFAFRFLLRAGPPEAYAIGLSLFLSGLSFVTLLGCAGQFSG